MEFYHEERVAVFIVLAVLIPAALTVGYIWYPQIFLPPQLRERDAVGVTVVGAVERPGAYRVPKGSLARDAAVLAGPNGDAALDYLDSPVPLVANELVYVPRVVEKTAVRERNRETALRRLRMPVQVRRIDINAAPQDELATIPGIGDKLAEAIVLSRTQEAFLSTDDIKRVWGIGPKKYEKIKGYITVEEPAVKSQILNPKSQ